MFVTALFIKTKKKMERKQHKYEKLGEYLNYKTHICKILIKDVLESFLSKRAMAMILRGKTRIQNVIQY